MIGKSRFRWRLAVALCAVVTAVCAYYTTSTSATVETVDEERVVKVTTVPDVKLEVTSPLISRAGQPHEIEIVVTNNATQNMYWYHINGYRDCTVRVFDGSGNAVPFTPLGYQQMGGSNLVRTKNVRRQLAAGGSHTWRINLAECFEMPPGDYSVSVSLELNSRRFAMPFRRGIADWKVQKIMRSFEVAVEDVRFQIAP